MKTRTETAFGVIWGVLARFAAIAVLVYAVYRVRSILVAVLISVLAAYVAVPAVNLLTSFRIRGFSFKWHRFWATLLVFVVLAGLVVVALRVFITPFESELSDLTSNIGNYADQARDLLEKAASWYGALPPRVREFLSHQQVSGAADIATGWAKSLVAGTLGKVTYVLDIILIPVLAFYFVLDSRSLKREFVPLLPRRRWREALGLINYTSRMLQSYVIGQIILCVIAGGAVGIVLRLLGMDYALVLAVLAGVARAIPIIGPIVSGIPIVLLATLQSTSLGVKVLIFFVVLHFVESKVIMPSLMSARVRLHPALVIVVLLIGGQFFGIIGMFLAVPVAAVIREAAWFYLVRPHLKQVESASADEVDATSESEVSD